MDYHHDTQPAKSPHLLTQVRRHRHSALIHPRTLQRDNGQLGLADTWPTDPLTANGGELGPPGIMPAHSSSEIYRPDDKDVTHSLIRLPHGTEEQSVQVQGNPPHPGGPAFPDRPTGPSIGHSSAGLQPHGASLHSDRAGNLLDYSPIQPDGRTAMEDNASRTLSPTPTQDGDVDFNPGQPKDHSTPRREGTQPYKQWPTPSPGMHTEAATLYNAARSALAEHKPPPRLDHTTALATMAWEVEATGHPDDLLVLKGIKYGFSIQYAGPPVLNPTAAYNHQSAVNYPDDIDAYFQKELAEHALSGPYSTPPFTPWFVSSPMMTREKPGGDGRRVIVDLSFPNGGVNQYIAPHVYDGQEAVHHLPTIASAVSTIAATPPGDIQMAVIDLSRAYRQFPVTPMDWPLLGISWRSNWAFDRRLPFGCRMSSFIMQTVAQFIVRALATRRVHAHMYLDDILVVSPTQAVAAREYHAVLTLLKDLGLDVAAHKLQPPAPAVIWLGIHIDVDANQLSIPAPKLGQIKDCMAQAAKRSYLNKKHLQRLIGLANHLSKVVRAARTFICRLLAALRAATSDHIRVTKEVRADLAWYAKYLSTYNARAIIPNERVVMRIWADACLKGAGASDGRRYYEHVFSKPFSAAHHIAHLEGLNCLAAVRLFVSASCAGGTVEIMCDNRPSVDAFTSGRARDEVLAACARALWYHAATKDVDLRFTHVPGEGMALPDALSRASDDAAGRARADHFISKLSLRRVRVRGSDYNYKEFL